MSAFKTASCGLDFAAVPDIQEGLHVATASKYHFVTFPITHPNFKREFIKGKAKNRPGPVTRSDMILCSSDWSQYIVGKLSPYIDVDSTVPFIAKNSRETINQELSFATHLGLIAITIKLKGNLEKTMNLAQIVYNKIAAEPHFQAFIWVQVPMENPIKQVYSHRVDKNVDEMEVENTWNWWNAFRIVCNYHKKLIVALIVSNDVPDKEEILRWIGEPVKCLIIPTSVFITNKKGYPVLSKGHQDLIKAFVPLDVQYIITGSNRHQNIAYYYHYLDHLWKNWQPDGTIERFARGFEDYLQNPLQPLMDNLESSTYEIFEKDPIKYELYQRAIQSALVDRAELKKKEKDETPIVVMVVGAGRGPLVRAALNASISTRTTIKLYAVEKNPNAIITLQALKKEMWGDQVTIVSSDMREWKAPEKCDILVSELLGSFGDNELSPECLDGAQKFLKDDGISIPQAYSSYVAPVQANKLYNEVRAAKSTNEHESNFEMPYVVQFQNKYDIDEPQILFTFVHPNKDDPIDNSRYGKNTFKASQDCILHGFSGYFDCQLYKDVMMSIEPRTHSPKMFSWFPIFFPIKTPVHLKAGDEIVSHFWRCGNTKNVWYEWSVEKPIPVAIHNPNGRSSKIGL
ncbi:protein arginine N-methyltransferase 5 [Trichogramma pretiosum]|uniref:protein arginine N-methyltransferase 5 n=1 Tax=Trichogramma pretiosum TaxID=7493 RepID=UPI0006C961D8|nr:protein arginine N-methyltransferase 5 [Trichogramma pretiosum]